MPPSVIWRATGTSIHNRWQRDTAKMCLLFVSVTASIEWEILIPRNIELLIPRIIAMQCNGGYKWAETFGQVVSYNGQGNHASLCQRVRAIQARFAIWSPRLARLFQWRIQSASWSRGRWGTIKGSVRSPVGWAFLFSYYFHGFGQYKRNEPAFFRSLLIL